MNRGFVCAGLVVMLSAACHGGDTPPPVVADTGPIAWAFEAPESWDQRVKLVEANLRGQQLSARTFVIAPRDSSVLPQVLLGIVVYDSGTWSRVAAEPGPPQGDVITTVGGQVFVASLPQSNPFAPGSADALTFDSLAVDIEGVKRGFRVMEKPVQQAPSAHPREPQRSGGGGAATGA